jgi:hypothetical protein
MQINGSFPDNFKSMLTRKKSQVLMPILFLNPGGKIQQQQLHPKNYPSLQKAYPEPAQNSFDSFTFYSNTTVLFS